jgi:hypothetical protein
MWCVAELDEEYIRRMEDVLALYEKPLSERPHNQANFNEFLGANREIDILATIEPCRCWLQWNATIEILERVEIDHTPLDLFVVDDDTGMPLGRPYVTLCIDDFSRCILGMHIGFTSPSYQSVVQFMGLGHVTDVHRAGTN